MTLWGGGKTKKKSSVCVRGFFLVPVSSSSTIASWLILGMISRGSTPEDRRTQNKRTREQQKKRRETSCPQSFLEGVWAFRFYYAEIFRTGERKKQTTGKKKTTTTRTKKKKISSPSQVVNEARHVARLDWEEQKEGRGRSDGLVPSQGYGCGCTCISISISISRAV